MTNHQRLFALVVCVILAVPAIASAQQASAQQFVGVGAGVYTEDGDLSATEKRDVAPSQDQSYSYDSHNMMMAGIWYLRNSSENIRWGGGLRYYGSYSIVEIPDQPNGNNDQIDPYELGQLTDLYVQAEWLLHFGGNKALILGAQLGPSILSPDGEFHNAIKDLKDQGVNVWDTPRLGYNVAPQVGGLWQLDDRLSLRADLGVRYESLFLFAIDDNVDGVAFSKHWSTSTLRYEFGLSMEVKI